MPSAAPAGARRRARAGRATSELDERLPCAATPRADDLELDLEIDEDFLQRVRDA